jgi:hypothetical protein
MFGEMHHMGLSRDRLDQRRRETGETALGLRSHSAKTSLLPRRAWFLLPGLLDAADGRHR